MPKQQIHINNSFLKDSSLLACPNCGQEYLHQKEVRATWRTEDADGTTYTSSYRKHSIESVKSEAITGRRDALEIHFECECCDGVKILEIHQHKGFTIMGWKV